MSHFYNGAFADTHVQFIRFGGRFREVLPIFGFQRFCTLRKVFQPRHFFGIVFGLKAINFHYLVQYRINSLVAYVQFDYRVQGEKEHKLSKN